MYDGREIANYILDYADDNGIVVTNLSLQKITYFCHTWYLISTEKPLIRHQFEAWEYGPVLPYLYRIFSSFGDQKITSRATRLDAKTGKEVVANIDIGEYEENLLKNIISFYSQLSSTQLVDQSHAPDGPWHKVWHHESKVNPGMQISNEAILNFYSIKNRPYTLQ